MRDFIRRCLRDSLLMTALLLVILAASCAADAQVPAAAETHRADMTRSARTVFGPGAPVATLAAQIHQESGWRTDARSWVGAQGLAQFMPATAADMAQRYPQHCAPANPHSPRWAFACRDRYMAAQLRTVRVPMAAGLDECSAWAFALRGYNGGTGWIQRDRRAARSAGADADHWLVVEPFNAGRNAAAIRENREYPHRIFKIEARYAAAGWGAGLGCEVPA